MKDYLEPIDKNSVKQQVLLQMEQLIVTGKLRSGEKLPPERDLANTLNVSRPILHEALVELATKGLVSIVPRRGTIVNDYQEEGNLALLTTLLENQTASQLDRNILIDLLEFRKDFESKLASLAAQRHSSLHIERFHQFSKNRDSLACSHSKCMAESDFRFHHLLAEASGNRIYPLLMNSFKPILLLTLSEFYKNTIVWNTVKRLQNTVLDAVLQRDSQMSYTSMLTLLQYGEDTLMKQISGEDRDDS